MKPIDMMNLRTMHFYNRSDNSKDAKGGLCVVYHWNQRDSYITISTATCSKNDTYNRTVGRNLAENNMLFGYTVNLPFNRKVWKNPRNMLRDMFKESVLDNFDNIPLYVGKDVGIVGVRFTGGNW